MKNAIFQHLRWPFLYPFLSALFVFLFCSKSFGDCVQTVETARAQMLATSVEDQGLMIRWSGAASVVIDNGTTSILIDPFVSRAKNGFSDILFHRKAEIEKNLIDVRVQRPEIARARTILVGHSHYDHSLDVPYFAECTRAQVIGSPSTGRILVQSGYGNFKSVIPNDELEKHEVDGHFKVRVLQGKHGAAPFGINFLDDTVGDQLAARPSVNEYGMGEVYSFLIEHKFGTVLHIGSAGIVPGSLDHLKGKVDVVMLALVGRGKTAPFLEEVLKAVEPRYVIPIHYDNLFHPLTSPLRVTPLAKFRDFLRIMEAKYGDVEVVQLGFDELWRLPH